MATSSNTFVACNDHRKTSTITDVHSPQHQKFVPKHQVFPQSREVVAPETCDMDSFVDCGCFTSHLLPLFMTCFHLVDHSDTILEDNFGQIFSSWPCPAVKP